MASNNNEVTLFRGILLYESYLLYKGYLYFTGIMDSPSTNAEKNSTIVLTDTFRSEYSL